MKDLPLFYSVFDKNGKPKEIVISSKQTVEYEKQNNSDYPKYFPETCFVFFTNYFYTMAVEYFDNQPKPVNNYENYSFHNCKGNNNSDKFDFMMCLSGIGAPICALSIEMLISNGVKNIIGIGSAGGIQENLSIGDIILCEKSIRDEGTSLHYENPSKYSYSNSDLIKSISAELNNENISFHKGGSWTTDAIFRETKEKFIEFKKEGILTVDMESAAIFSICKHFGVLGTSIFFISDILKENSWCPSYYDYDFSVNAYSIFKILNKLVKEKSFN